LSIFADNTNSIARRITALRQQLNRHATYAIAVHAAQRRHGRYLKLITATARPALQIAAAGVAEVAAAGAALAHARIIATQTGTVFQVSAWRVVRMPLTIAQAVALVATLWVA
jgi:hypothetical protein